MAPRIAATLNHILGENAGSELKWGKITRQRAALYQQVYAAIWQLIEKNYLHFYALVVDTTRVDHRQYNDGDRDLGFTKFLFTLLFKFVRIHSRNSRFYVFLDDRTTQHTPDKLKVTLNAKCRKVIHRDFPPYRTVEFVDSKNSRLVQIADLMSGLIAYDTNMHYTKVGAAKHKADIMIETRKLFHVPSFSVPTPYDRADGFDIWHLDFDAKARRAAKA